MRYHLPTRGFEAKQTVDRAAYQSEAQSLIDVTEREEVFQLFPVGLIKVPPLDLDHSISEAESASLHQLRLAMPCLAMPCLWHGKAWQGMARHSKARHGMARHSKAVERGKAMTVVVWNRWSEA